MQRLRKKDTGCPWDIEQSYQTITPSTVEEVYEVVDALERNDYAHLKEELGDLLFQIIFYAQLANEEERFNFDDIVHALVQKLLRRHPHVFPDGTLESERDLNAELSSDGVNQQWEKIKLSERSEKGKAALLDDVPLGLPSLVRAQKLQKRASKVGFDWQSTEQVIAKVREELDEFESARKVGLREEMADELGDLIFSCVNLARFESLDSDQCLRASSRKFVDRIHRVETEIQLDGLSWADCGAATLDDYWRKVKGL